ncbi:MAG: type V CRISPR-associated endonuclease Cas1 [Opitutales bacterium]
MLSFPDFKYKQVIVHSTFGNGEKLKFSADNILIKDFDGNTILQHSCHKIFALFIVGDISVTSVVLRRALKYGFPIILMSSNMKVSARINCIAEGNTLLRKRQYSSERNLLISKYLIEQKVSNQLALLKALRAKNLSNKEAIKRLEQIDVWLAYDTPELMGIEGNASRIFFDSYFRVLNWNRREPRCKRDIINLLLDIGYTYLFNFIEANLCLYGFDLYCGVHHKFFYNRKSLVCDIIEPFRCIIDRRIRKAHNLGQIDKADFIERNGAYLLTYEKQKKYTKLFLKDILAEKENIFKFCQSYYRSFMRDKDIVNFPQYKID